MTKNSVLSEGALDKTVRDTINNNLQDVSKVTTEFDVDSGGTGTTLTNVAGMITEELTAGTYRFYVHLDMLSTANSGLKAGFKFGGDFSASMLTSIAAVARLFTASAVAVSRVTTATDAASLVASTTAIINAVIEGTLVVAPGKKGTLQLQAAQNASHADNTTIYVTSFMTFTRIGN
jgi:hypothetical protein